MGKRTVAKLAGLVAVLIAAATVAADDAARGRPLRIAIPAPPTNFDPVQTVDVETLQIHLNTHAYLRHPLGSRGAGGLLSFPEKKAEGAGYALSLENEMYFCGPNGKRKIGSEDIVASLERAARHPRSRVAWALERIRRNDDGKLAVSVDRWGGLTIEFGEEFHKRYVDGLLALPQLAVLPRETGENIAPHQSSFGGDYWIRKADGQRLLLERCNAPDNAEPTIELEAVRDPQVALAGLLAGRYDVIRADYTTWLSLKQRGYLPGGPDRKVEFLEGIRNDLEFVVFNVKNRKLADAAVRRALLHALDTRRLCHDVFQGFCSISGFDPWFGREESFYDLAKAKKFWQESQSRPEALELLTLSDDLHQKMAAWVAAEWERELGVKVALRSLNFASLVGELMGGKEFDAALLWIQPLSLLPEVRYLAWLGDPPPKGRNFARYDPPAWREAIDRTRRSGLGSDGYEQLAKVLLDDPPIAPLASIRRGWFLGRGVWAAGASERKQGFFDVLMYRDLHLVR